MIKSFGMESSGAGRGGGKGSGRGQGKCRGMGGGGVSTGPGGECVCPSCGAASPHQAGVPCYQVECPKCGTIMQRKRGRIL